MKIDSTNDLNTYKRDTNAKLHQIDQKLDDILTDYNTYKATNDSKLTKLTLRVDNIEASIQTINETQSSTTHTFNQSLSTIQDHVTDIKHLHDNSLKTIEKLETSLSKAQFDISENHKSYTLSLASLEDKLTTDLNTIREDYSKKFLTLSTKKSIDIEEITHEIEQLHKESTIQYNECNEDIHTGLQSLQTRMLDDLRRSHEYTLSENKKQVDESIQVVNERYNTVHDQLVENQSLLKEIVGTLFSQDPAAALGELGAGSAERRASSRSPRAADYDVEYTVEQLASRLPERTAQSSRPSSSSSHPHVNAAERARSSSPRAAKPYHTGPTRMPSRSLSPHYGRSALRPPARESATPTKRVRSTSKEATRTADPTPGRETNIQQQLRDLIQKQTSSTRDQGSSSNGKTSHVSIWVPCIFQPLTTIIYCHISVYVAYTCSSIKTWRGPSAHAWRQAYRSLRVKQAAAVTAEL